MKPYQFLPIHPLLKDVVSLIAVMHMNFAELSISPVYRFPWMNNTHVFFPLADDPLWVKSEPDPVFHSYSSAYFVGPKLCNDIADFGRERHVVGITFKPGAMQRLIALPGKELANLDIDATYIFGNSLRDVEGRLREAKGNAAILAILENFLFGLMASVAPETPFDGAMKELVKHNGNLSVEAMAGYACKSVRQLERISLDKLGMSPRLFARLVRFGNVFALKEARPDHSWGEIAYQFGYHDQMHLIRDFKMFTGSTPTGLAIDSPSSVKMMAALYGRG